MAFYNCNILSQVVLNEGLLSIDDLSFANNAPLKVIDLPDSLTTIKSYAFSHCCNLQQVNSTNNSHLVEIQDGAFEFTSIEELRFNPSIKSIPEPINMAKLKRITFHESKILHFKECKDGTVYQCFNNSDVILPNDNDRKFASYLPLDVVKRQETLEKLIFVPKDIEHLKIEESFTLFENFHSFNSKKYCFINHISILSNYAYLSSGCFSYFKSIQEVEFGQATTLYFILEKAFLGYINLQKIVIPLSCVVIGKKAFKNGFNLQTISFGMIDKSTD